MKHIPWLLLIFSLFAMQNSHAENTAPPLQCVAFSPYVNQLSPHQGNAPSAELIGILLDTLIKQTPFRCIMTYGVLDGLEAIFPAAKQRDFKVIAILWLDENKTKNSESISQGIALAQQYPETIIRLSCGSEVRTRNAYSLDDETDRCLKALREAKVTQPIGVNDTWWEWCNQTSPCQKNHFSDQVDWIGINIFPWWENRFFDDLFCLSSEQAADFHLARWQDVTNANPTKEVIVTEFGWPSGPKDQPQIGLKTNKSCGIANREKQQHVIETTFKKFAEKQVTGIAFEAFSEIWKPTVTDSNFEHFWGLCDNMPPYTCHVAF
ncbi:exo-beta-1,3-glucanase [Methylobacter sp. S3L5C]|uniref:exo-beta-1,3-glucanase n=1 Tax=Methylobacter sp. S3L5C TaxID=2839024 RepID=UPI001FAC0E65|nr:exo-beta-1,3-glucanase [Methylobacter sp. S3L5C]UOA07092.1 exo-beta-1,3-glucanase [Methylobacter sp. S3L5C]